MKLNIVIHCLLHVVNVTGFWISGRGSHNVLVAATSPTSSTYSSTTTTVAAYENGDETCLNDIDQSVQSTIQKFLDSHSPKSDKFYIQGWRWHTLSLIRDTDRLAHYARATLRSLTRDKIASTQKAVDHVIDFNLKGLYRIEDDVFLPWLRSKLSSDEIGSDDVKKAFEIVLDSVESDRKHVKKLASSISFEAKSAVGTNKNDDSVEKAIMEVMEQSETLHGILKSIKYREDQLLVPGVMRVATTREQKSFNTKVLRSLGIFESRKHLVGMHDAVYDPMYGNNEEQSLFLEQIPSVARMMIGRWKRTLYEPAAGILDE